MEEKKLLLIVDDDKAFADQLSDKAQKVGFNVHVAASGKEALDYIAEHRVDFIILDFIMPEMDGYTFYHILTHDMKKQIPAVVLTALSRLDDNKEGPRIFEKSETDLDELMNQIRDSLIQKSAE